MEIVEQIGFDIITKSFQDNSLPFDTYGAISGVFMLFLWLITFLFCIMLIDANLMSQKAATVIYLITFIIGGILLVAIPNTLLPFRVTLEAIATKIDLWFLLPVLAVLTILFSTSLLVGRIFCGYACPLGTFQELLSKINFKSNIKDQKANKFHIKIPRQHSSWIRWYFVGFLFTIAFLGIPILDILTFLDPFSGFSILRSPLIGFILLSFFGLVVVGIASLFLYRPYCGFLCPFGAGSDLCSRHARKIYKRTDDCTECGLCEEICPTQEAAVDSNKGECYYCNRCIEVCPENAIKLNLDG
ncbi:MAG: 4Fe-4S binding protein [Candidatus Hodarchaeales archaeon]